MASKIIVNLDTSIEFFLNSKCKQNDDLILECNIFENGLAKDLSNCSIVIQALKADKTYIIQNTDITKSNNKFISNLVRDFTRVPGTTKIEIVLVESSKQNTTFSFSLEVIGSVIKGAVESPNTVTILENLQEKIVEAGAVKEETEQLIKSGGAATTGDIQKVNAHLEQKAHKDFVTYEDFGAVGDGIQDDYLAIYNAHIFANENNINIKLDSNKKYLIKDFINGFIPIKTNVDFNYATIIIDDTDITVQTALDDAYRVISSMNEINITGQITYLNKKDKYIESLKDYDDIMLYIENSNVRHFIRKGVNADNGYPQQEVLRVSRGYIVSPINFDYTTITKCTIIPIDKTILKISNVKFITKLNKLDNVYGDGVNRGLKVMRSNTIISNVSCYVENEETTTSKPYNGFINFTKVADCLYENSILQARLVRNDINSVPMGTYSLAYLYCINVKFNNITTDGAILRSTTEYWGVTVGNYCKDLIFEKCVLNRIDVHRGANNVIINNCTLGTINMIGQGLLKITNTSVLANNFISLREDYGSSWDGDIIIEDCTLNTLSTLGGDVSIVNGRNTQDHNFGYKCYFPNVTIKNFKIDFITTSGKVLFLFYNKQTTHVDCYKSYDEEVTNGKYPYIYKQYLNIDNLVANKNIDIRLFYDTPQHCYAEAVNEVKNNSPLSSDSDIPLELNSIVPNFNITLRNLILKDSKSNSSNGIIFKGGSDTSKNFTFNNHRLVPRIILDKCTSGINGGSYPLIIESQNSTILCIYNGNSEYLGNLYFTSCIIGRKQEIENEGIIVAHHKNLTFDKCYFINPSVNTPTRESIRNAYSFFTVIGIKENYYRISARLNACKYEFSPSIFIASDIERDYNVSPYELYRNINFTRYYKVISE